MPALDREKALDVALAQIDKQFGKGSVMRLGDETRVPIQVIPTGSSTPIGSTSTLNISGANRTVAASNVVSAATGSITIHTQSATHLVYDVTGFFT